MRRRSTPQIKKEMKKKEESWEDFEKVVCWFMLSSLDKEILFFWRENSELYKKKKKPKTGPIYDKYIQLLWKSSRKMMDAFMEQNAEIVFEKSSPRF